MFVLRDYQKKAIDAVHEKWKNGVNRVCLVSPTGSGKTVMGLSCIDEFQYPLWIVHRDELIRQVSNKLPIFAKTMTVQKMVSTGIRPLADVVIFDEAHHYVAEKWKQVSEPYANLPTLGLTATPQRQDGKPLNDLFDDVIVAAKYSELIDLGHIVNAKIYRPMFELDSGSIALEPVKAYQEKALGTKAFLFAPTVANAKEFSDQFNAAGITSATIHGTMRRSDRIKILKKFKNDEIKVLCNVYVLTEGVDVPEAQTVIFARGVSHAGPFMQMAGRVLRPAHGKKHAIILDLPGLTYVHGSPTSDRHYSIDGSSNMQSSEQVPFKQCPQCAQLVRKTRLVCDECGYQFPEAKNDIKIYNTMLVEVYDGNNTPVDAKNHEWNRLVELVKSRGWKVEWAIKQYQKLFPGEFPVLSQEDKKKIYSDLITIQKTNGYKQGFAKVRFKQIVGHWP